MVALALGLLLLLSILLGGMYLGNRLAGGGAKARLLGWWQARQERASLERGELVWRPVRSTLHALEVAERSFGLPPNRGGALAWIGDGQILYADGLGGFGLITSAGAHVRLPFTAPMNRAAFESAASRLAPNANLAFFKVSDILLRPETEAGRYSLFVAHHVYDDASACSAFAVSAAAVRIGPGEAQLDLAGWRRLWTAQPCVPFTPDLAEGFAGHMAGGRLTLSPERALLLSMGDHGFGVLLQRDAWRQAIADPGFSHAKLHAIDPETGASEVVATGFRNPQGLLLDDSERIWTTELGPLGGDELNLIEPGENYGWPFATLGVEYGHKPWLLSERQGRHYEGRKPKLAWSPAIAPTQLVQMRGDEFPEWDGDLLVATLGAGQLTRVRLNGDTPILSEAIPLSRRLRDLRRLPNGALMAWTENSSLLLIRNAERADRAGADGLESLLPWTRPDWRGEGAVAAAADGGSLFAAHCSACHALQDQIKVGPLLHTVAGRRIAAYPEFGYSAALATHTGETWNEGRLRRFIENPQAFAPGSAMPGANLSASEAAAIARYLQAPG